MGQAFITRRGGGGYAEGDVINSANITPIYDADSLNFTTYDVIKDMSTQYSRIYVNPQGTRIYGCYNGSSYGNLDIYSTNGSKVSTISIQLIGTPAFDNLGNMYCNTINSDSEYYFYQFKTDGTSKQLLYVHGDYECVFWANNLINITDVGYIRQYNTSGTQTGSFKMPESSVYYGCQGDGTNLYLISGSAVIKITNTGTQVWKTTVSTTGVGLSVAYYNGYVYYMDGTSNSHISRMSSSGTVDSSWQFPLTSSAGKLSIVTVGNNKYLSCGYENSVRLVDFTSKNSVLNLAGSGSGIYSNCYGIANDTGVPYYWANKLFELHTAPTGYQIIE